jgi:hypothetical protein
MKVCIVKPDMRRPASGKSRSLLGCTEEKHELMKNGPFPAEGRTVSILDNIYFNTGPMSSISYTEEQNQCIYYNLRQFHKCNIVSKPISETVFYF